MARAARFVFCFLENERRMMPVEIEAKIKVENFDDVRARLQKAGAGDGTDHFETNTFFDTEDHSLLAADKGLRLRLTRDEQSGAEQHIVTYKGPRRPGPLKSREEVEVSVNDPEQATRLFEQLGFKKLLSFEKRRQSWNLDGCKVELDTVPHLGTFVEIEGAGEQAVMKVRQTLGLSDRPLVKTSYVALLTGHLQERGLPRRDVRFNDATHAR